MQRHGEVLVLDLQLYHAGELLGINPISPLSGPFVALDKIVGHRAPNRVDSFVVAFEKHTSLSMRQRTCQQPVFQVAPIIWDASPTVYELLVVACSANAKVRQT